jgi:hypothetical protein
MTDGHQSARVSGYLPWPKREAPDASLRFLPSGALPSDEIRFALFGDKAKTMQSQ